MQEVTLNFKTEDEGLNLRGTVNFPERTPVNFSTLTIRGLAEWRHVPANIVHVSQRFMEASNIMSKAQGFSKVGQNFIGIAAQSDILLSHAVRTGKNGTRKVQEQLTKFFKVLGASSIKFEIIDLPAQLANDNQPTEAGNDGND